MRKRILFVGDMENWSIHHVYQYMRNEMRKYYWFDYCTLRRFIRYKWLLLQLYDYVYISFAFLLRKAAIDKRYKYKILTGVHCHWEFCDRTSLESAMKTAETIDPGYLELLNQASRVAAISKILYDILKTHGYSNVYYMPHGIDIKLFYPEERNRSDDVFRVGWAQSETNHGFKRRIAEIENACRELPGVELDKIGNLEKRLIDFKSIRKWYNSLDCYVCFSIFEGGPLPVLEAMACGIPCISSPVGQVPEIIIDGQNGFIVETKEELKEKLVLLKHNHELRKKISINARKTILEKRTPQVIGKYWRMFFE